MMIFPNNTRGGSIGSVSKDVAWYERLDLSKIGDEDGYLLLEDVVEKIGKQRVQEAFNISRFTM